MNSKILVAYFSASGVTAKVAKKLAEAAGADLYEVMPEKPYTRTDLDWTDKKSRSTVEMNDPDFRPAIAGEMPNMEKYDAIFVGFPIWWYVAPTIINTFLEKGNFEGKAVIPFATSGGSGMGETNARLQPSCPGAILMTGKILNGGQSVDSLRRWVESLNL